MAGEATRLATPHPPFGLVAMATLRTPAGGSSLRPGEARNAHPFQLLFQIAHVATVLPLAHALIVLPSGGPPANAVRVADEHFPHRRRDAQLHHSGRALVCQVAHLSFNSTAVFVAGARQFLPAPAALCAARLQAGDFALPLVLTALQAALAPAGNNQRRPGGGSHRRLVDLTEVDGGFAGRRRGRLGRYLKGDVQLVGSAIPDQFAAAGHKAVGFGQNNGRSAATHRQDDVFSLDGDSLRRPKQGVVTLVAPRILGLAVADLAVLGRGVDVGEKGVGNHLHGLRVQRELALGRFLHRVPARPRRMFSAGDLVQVPAAGPDPGRFAAPGGDAREHRPRQLWERVDTDDGGSCRSFKHDASIAYGRYLANWKNALVPLSDRLSLRMASKVPTPGADQRGSSGGQGRH